MTDRIKLLRALLKEQGLPAILINSAVNRRYLSGFTGGAGWLLITPEHAFLFTDSRYTLQAAAEAPAFSVHQVVNPGKTIAEWLVEVAAQYGIPEMGFEAAHTSFAEHADLTKGIAGAFGLRPAAGLVEQLRTIKDDAELAAMRKAIDLTDYVMETVIAQLRPEHSELDAAWMFEKALREGGAERPSFPIIVAAGPNAAQAHHRPCDDKLGVGRSIIIDMGAHINGYNADLTRTIILGDADERFWTIYNTVLAAHQRAIDGVRAGVHAHEVDALARDYIASAGYGDKFGHGLGHGIGMEVHEFPFVRWTSPGGTSPLIQPGVVTSIEPGIYIEGWGGVRIEDLVLVTAEGCEVLSHAAKIHQP